uniref:Uncharacterized protein n=1 Tax=Oryza brachyantha TaxID=4533 RepID=J3N3Q9_ORYBR
MAGSTAVLAVILVVDVVAFGLAIGAEQSRPTVRIPLTFLIAESCLLAGLVQSAYHTRYRTVIFENPPDCEMVRRGTFGAGAAFSLITCVLTGAYYYYFSKARVSFHRREATIGMNPFS